MVRLKRLRDKKRQVFKSTVKVPTRELKLNQKSVNSIVYTGYLNVWEGAVRSSKTVVSAIAFMSFVYESEDSVFIMSGKTIASLYRNVITGDFGILELYKGMVEYKRDSQNNSVLSILGQDGREKLIYCFGANDERSYQTLRGLTAGGWYADEINLQNRNFIEEAFRRTIVSKQRKHFWTLNPDNPYHFIYSDFIDKYTEQNLKGFWLWFFTLDDNPSLTEERKRELASQYSGIFYKRYILGIRCVAEGAIYDMFTNENIYTENQKPNFRSLKFVRYIAMDYGTVNPCVFLDIFDDGEVVWVDNEYYYDSKKQMKQKSDEEYADDYYHFVEDWYRANDPTLIGRPEGILDPSAASFAVALKKRGFFVTDADNDVENGIRRVATMLARRTIMINERCKNTIKEITSYSWDDKKVEVGKEEPIKANDHSCDALRYFVNTRVGSWRVGEIA